MIACTVGKYPEMRLFWEVGLLLIMVAVAASHPPRLMWVERFDMFDMEDTWSHVITGWGGGNDEFQFYRNDRKNSFVKDGLLHIRPTFSADELGERFLSNGTLKVAGCTREPCNIRGGEHEIIHPIFSAQITTKNSFAFKYGRIEIRAKMPRGDWIWPAIWMLPKNPDHYGGWPRSGEIDIVEIRANKDYKDADNMSHGIDQTGSTLHFGPNVFRDLYHLTHWTKTANKGDYADDFHVYGMDWTNTSMVFTVDGEEVGSVTPPAGGFWELGKLNENPGGESVWKGGERMAPFDQEFYIVMNVAVGGHFFPPHWRSGGKPRVYDFGSGNAKKQFWAARKQWQPTWEQPEMLVDHILVYGWD